MDKIRELCSSRISWPIEVHMEIPPSGKLATKGIAMFQKIGKFR